WVMGEMCCTTYNHVSTPNTTTCAGIGFPGNMSNMAMVVPPTSYHSGGVNVGLGDGSVRFVNNSISLQGWRALGTIKRGEVITAGAMGLFRSAAAALLAAGLLLAAGCSRGPKKDEDFPPPHDKAKQALEAALNHWQGGHPPGGVPGATPAVEVVDSAWKS